MTRLFLRFYLGVIVILVAAWLIQAYVFRQSTVEENVPVVEEIFASSGRMARDRIVEGGEERFPETLAYLESCFDYPIAVVTRAERPMADEMIARLDGGESVLYYDRMETAIPETEFLVEMGPLPRFDEPTQTELSFALGGVFGLTAVGIAFLLRPVIIQLRGVEKTALAIAGGDLSARIDSARFRPSAAIAGAFNDMADRIEALLQSQRELLQTVSHELRTPLSRIKFATELLESAKSDEQREQRIHAIDDATDRLDKLVGELLTYARLEAESDAAVAESIDVRRLVDELVEFHAPLHPSVKFSCDVSSDLAQIDGDRHALSRAIGNLLSNAGDFAQSVVSVSVDVSGESVNFAVEDDGPGIEEADYDRVFEPFTMLDRGQGDRGGTGLGLSLVKRIAERSGGSVTIARSGLGGAKMILTLPIGGDTASKAFA